MSEEERNLENHVLVDKNWLESNQKESAKHERQLLAASLGNKRLREGLIRIERGETNPNIIASLSLSAINYDDLAGLYLELREKAIAVAVALLVTQYPHRIGELRDILKRIKEQG